MRPEIQVANDDEHMKRMIKDARRIAALASKPHIALKDLNTRKARQSTFKAAAKKR